MVQFTSHDHGNVRIVYVRVCVKGDLAYGLLDDHRNRKSVDILRERNWER